VGDAHAVGHLETVNYPVEEDHFDLELHIVLADADLGVLEYAGLLVDLEDGLGDRVDDVQTWLEGTLVLAPLLQQAHAFDLLLEDGRVGAVAAAAEAARAEYFAGSADFAQPAQKLGTTVLILGLLLAQVQLLRRPIGSVGSFVEGIILESFGVLVHELLEGGGAHLKMLLVVLLRLQRVFLFHLYNQPIISIRTNPLNLSKLTLLSISIILPKPMNEHE